MILSKSDTVSCWLGQQVVVRHQSIKFYRKVSPHWQILAFTKSICTSSTLNQLKFQVNSTVIIMRAHMNGQMES